jgi:uncharacterized peroxidase-related enzyme
MSSSARRSRPSPMPREEAPELESVLQQYEQKSGFLPNNMLIMAKRPALLKANLAMAEAVADTTLDRYLRDLVFLMVSIVSDGQYSIAHRVAGLRRRGADAEAIRAVWDFEASSLFDTREKLVLSFARAIASTPSSVSDSMMEGLREHFTENEIIDLVAQACFASWANRWNATMLTQLEPLPLAEMKAVVPDWDPKAHAP